MRGFLAWDAQLSQGEECAFLEGEKEEVPSKQAGDSGDGEGDELAGRARGMFLRQRKAESRIPRVEVDVQAITLRNDLSAACWTSRSGLSGALGGSG